jgi:hypothetical protein
MRRNISRTSWVLPSPTAIRHHEFIPEAVGRTMTNSCGTTLCPSSSVPLASFVRSASSGTPFTLAKYSRSTP